MTLIRDEWLIEHHRGDRISESFACLTLLLEENTFPINIFAERARSAGKGNADRTWIGPLKTFRRSASTLSHIILSWCLVSSTGKRCRRFVCSLVEALPPLPNTLEAINFLHSTVNSRSVAKENPNVDVILSSGEDSCWHQFERHLDLSTPLSRHMRSSTYISQDYWDYSLKISFSSETIFGCSIIHFNNHPTCWESKKTLRA